MQLNSLPQIYEVVITKFIEQKDVDFYATSLIYDDTCYHINQTFINHLHNKISYSLYFTDMISQTNFLAILPLNTFSYKLKGLIYTDELKNNLELFING